MLFVVDEVWLNTKYLLSYWVERIPSSQDPRANDRQEMSQGRMARRSFVILIGPGVFDVTPVCQNNARGE